MSDVPTRRIHAREKLFRVSFISQDDEDQVLAALERRARATLDAARIEPADDPHRRAACWGAAKGK
jgi:hypothetical protein